MAPPKGWRCNGNSIINKNIKISILKLKLMVVVVVVVVVVAVEMTCRPVRMAPSVCVWVCARAPGRIGFP